MNVGALVVITLGLGLVVVLFALRGFGRRSAAVLGDTHLAIGRVEVGRDAAMSDGAATDGVARGQGSQAPQPHENSDGTGQGHGCC